MKSTVNLTNVYGTKSITLDQYPPEAWNFLSGDAEGIDTASIRMLSEAVPWMYRGLNIIVQAVSTVPIALVKGKREAGYVGTEDITSPFPWVDDLPMLVRKIAASLILEGRGYLFRDKAKTVNATKKLWYWNPLTVTFDAVKTGQTNKLQFTRHVNDQVTDYTTDQVLYFWPEDCYVEVGPPNTSPAKAALAAAGVLYNVDQYVAAYFKRGAIRAMMLAVKGSPNADQKTELQKWWGDMTSGIKRAFRVFTVNADSVTPTMIGDGLEGLQDSALTQEKREDISTALGIPQTILFSTGASGIGGGGVVTEDTARFYQQTVVPLTMFIYDQLNQQQLKDTGYRFDVREEEMPMYQEDEGERAASLTAMVNALADPAKFLIAAEIQGYQLTDEATAKIKELIAAKAEAAATIAEQMTPKEEPKEDDEDEQEIPEPAKTDIARLRRKALKNIGKRFEFVSDTIPDLPALLERLYACACAEEIKAVLDAPAPAPVAPQLDYSELIKAITLEVEGIKAASKSATPAAQPINLTVHNHPGEAPQVHIDQQAQEPPVVHVQVDPTPVTVTNELPPAATNPPDESADVVKAIRKLARGK